LICGKRENRFHLPIEDQMGEREGEVGEGEKPSFGFQDNAPLTRGSREGGGTSVEDKKGTKTEIKETHESDPQDYREGLFGKTKGGEGEQRRTSDERWDTWTLFFVETL